MRAILIVFGVMAAVASAAPPVVVELFTSEGCSTCPPADVLLQQLEAGASGSEVIALSEHVTYWDRLGWKDRFSAEVFTRRQEQYGRRFHLESVYTPQIVVNGEVEFVGNDETRARKEIAKAAARQVGSVELKMDGNTVAVHAMALPVEAAGSEVILAVTETNLGTDVRSGENGGRKLTHTGVARSFIVIGRAAAGEGSVGFKGSVPLYVDSAWKRENVKVVVFVQDPVTKRIWSAGSARLN